MKPGLYEARSLDNDRIAYVLIGDDLDLRRRFHIALTALTLLRRTARRDSSYLEIVRSALRDIEEG